MYVIRRRFRDTKSLRTTDINETDCRAGKKPSSDILPRGQLLLGEKKVNEKETKEPNYTRLLSREI